MEPLPHTEDEPPPPPPIGLSPNLSRGIDRPRPSPVSTSGHYSFGWDESPTPLRALASPRGALYNGQSLFKKFSPQPTRRELARLPGGSGRVSTESVISPPATKRRCVTWPDTPSPLPNQVTPHAAEEREPHSDLIAQLWNG